MSKCASENIVFSNAHNRIVNKQGSYRVKLQTSRQSLLKLYLRDSFTTLVDAKWRWSILIFVMGFVLTWTIFAVIYLAFARSHGDIDEERDEDQQVCIENVYDFTTAFLFSVETQHTIGYGYRHVTTECPHIVLTVFLQFIFGIGVQCLTAALVFSKLIRSKRRGDSIVFSQKACLAVVDGQWRVMVRVADFRKSKLVGVKAKGILIKRSVINKKQQLDQTFIDFVSEGGSETLTLLWPAVIYHTVNRESPLWPPTNLRTLGGYSEIIVMLEGVIESTSRVVQTRTSYIPEEIHYGYKFQTICPQITEDGKYECSYFEINTVSPVVTPELRKRISVVSLTSRESTF
jgi:potassium inwardly-rectifying channel subfamily J